MIVKICGTTETIWVCMDNVAFVREFYKSTEAIPAGTVWIEYQDGARVELEPELGRKFLYWLDYQTTATIWSLNASGHRQVR